MIRTRHKIPIPTAPAAEDEDDVEEHLGFTALRALAAQLLLTAGAGATLYHLRNHDPDRHERRTGDDPHPLRRPEAATWAPLLLGSMAAAAQVAHAFNPSDATRAATRVLNGAVLGVGAADLGNTIHASITGRRGFSTSSLLFGSAGALGYLLDRQERETDARAARLERRARIVERWVPRRRPRLDRVVVHV